MKKIGISSKNSIAYRIGWYFFIMILFASLISGISLGIMWSNQSDARLLNVSGSLRMQSYRFIYEMEHHPETLPERLAQYQQSLNAPALQDLSHQYFLPTDLLDRYEHLKQSWQVMEGFIKRQDLPEYVKHIERYAEQVNNFVYALQKFAEFKLRIAISVIGISMLIIISLAYFGIWYTRRNIIYPLNQLVTASIQVQNEDFNHIKLPVQEANELGLLSSTFTQMASELAKLYASLEEKVEDKTRRLLAVNRSLLVLYQCSQLLTAKPINQQVLEQVLQTVLDNEHLYGIEIEIYDAEHWNVRIETQAQTQSSWRSREIAIENEKLAQLRWLPSLLCPDERLLQNVSEMIGRSLYVLQVQKQQQQLVLMEERSIIARELHDSLAQSLTFFKIQISLLKRNGEQNQDWQKQKTILNDLETALNEAYRQLRELLSAFRLTIQEANLGNALESMLDTLRPQTTAQIHLNCKLPSQMFTAQQQVHILQIVREAVINAIKHADASQIHILASTNADGEYYISIEDDGKGLSQQLQPDGHYGLTIMKERASELNAHFSLQNLSPQGLQVMLILPNLLAKVE